MSQTTEVQDKAPEGYKRVQLGPKALDVPTDWEVKRVDKITENLDKKREPIKSSERESGDVPYYGATGQVDSVSGYLFDEKLVLVGEDGADWSPFGGTSYIISGKSWVNNHVHVLRCTDIIEEFLSNYLDYIEMRQVISGTNRGKLNQSELNQFPVLYPPFPEQRRIADILSTVEKLIQDTDEAIERTDELSRGLMQKLLTTGTDSGVETREERIGPMPVDVAEDWKMKYFDDVIEINPNDAVPDEDSFPFLPMDAVNEETRSVDYWEHRSAEDCTRVRFRPGDTVYAKITPCTENGKIAFIEEPEGMAFGSTEFLVFRARRKHMIPKYVYYLSNLPQFRAVTISLMEGSTGRQRVPSDTFESNMQIPVPSMEEQEEIVEILDRVQERSRQERESKRQFENLKRGLMQDLLTGKVRVNPDN